MIVGTTESSLGITQTTATLTKTYFAKGHCGIARNMTLALQCSYRHLRVQVQRNLLECNAESASAIDACNRYGNGACAYMTSAHVEHAKGLGRASVRARAFGKQDNPKSKNQAQGTEPRAAECERRAGRVCISMRLSRRADVETQNAEQRRTTRQQLRGGASKKYHTEFY